MSTKSQVSIWDEIKSKRKVSEKHLSKKYYKKPPPPKRGLILDGISPKDYRELNFIYCCEQCSYFDPRTDQCSMGHHTEIHLRKNQLKSYDLVGKMAYCRNLEVD